MSATYKPSVYNNFNDKWALYGHLPHDTDWTFKSYKQIAQICSVEHMIAIYDKLPEALVNNCMLFLMRGNIKPIWEDPKNISGGCFSYKVHVNNVYNVWKRLSYALAGESLSSEIPFKTINGITISPKKNFCIIKIWLSSCEYQDPSSIFQISNEISPVGCLFKRHF
jgi:hypothetical protein